MLRTTASIAYCVGYLLARLTNYKPDLSPFLLNLDISAFLSVQMRNELLYFVFRSLWDAFSHIKPPALLND